MYDSAKGPEFSEENSASVRQDRLTHLRAADELTDNELYENAVSLLRSVRAAYSISSTLFESRSSRRRPKLT